MRDFKIFKEDLKTNRTIGQEVKTISINFLVFFSLMFLAFSYHNIFVTLKPALSTHPIWAGIIAILFAIPIILFLTFSINYFVAFLSFFVKFLCKVPLILTRIFKYFFSNNLYDNSTAKKYLYSIYENDINKDKKIKKWLFRHHMQDTIKLFDSDNAVSLIFNEKCYSYSRSYDTSNIFSFIAFSLAGLLLLTIILYYSISGTLFNMITLVCVLVFVIDLLLLATLRNVDFIVRDKTSIRMNTVAQYYPYAYKYFKIKDNFKFDLPETKLQVIDFFARKEGVDIRDLSWHEERRNGTNYLIYDRYYKSEDLHLIDENFKNKRKKLNKKSTKIAICCIIALFITVIPFRIFHIKNKLAADKAEEKFKAEMLAYNRECKKLQNEPDSIIVNVQRTQTDYYRIGSDWYFSSTFGKCNLNDSNCFALKDIVNKNITVKTTIIEQDETFDDRSSNSFSIKFNKKDLIENDSTLCWTTEQTVHENGKRKNQGYATWETDYIVSLKSKTPPNKPSMNEVNIDEISDYDFNMAFISEPVDVPIFKTKFDKIADYLNDLIEPIKKMFH